jgi:hypothetical protein
VTESTATNLRPTPGRVSLVRASRDGDQFHYLWAARRCLLLLAPATDLVAVAIEGASVISEGGTESTPGNRATEVDEVIDVAEYFGSQDLDHASAVRYAQLKHSTLHENEHWPPSKLEKTLGRFADKFREIEKRLGANATQGRFTFAFISNRAVDPVFVEAVQDVAAERRSRHPALLKKLSRFTALRDERLVEFARALRLDNKETGYPHQRQTLGFEISAYLPDADSDAPIQLKELVTRKALSESAANNVITKYDVLRALGTDAGDLFPANSSVEQLVHPVRRAQENEIVGEIVGAGPRPVVIHAEGGVGKSIFVSRVAQNLPAGSECFVYDCFGNGLYRSATAYRHPHKVALTQVVNEMASRGLCDPLIPSTKSDSSAYLRAFLHRLKQATDCLSESFGPDHERLVCVVIDAADNAELAAQELGARSFARDLIRESIPDGVRFVFVTRTHRQSLLNPPPNTIRLELLPFDEVETGEHLRRSFPPASDADAAEFHRLTTGNPRVQSLALSGSHNLQAVLRSLGPEPTTADGSISAILDAAVTRLKDNAASEGPMIDTICVGLSTLRPLVPISVLAKMSGVDPSAIRSFAFDLGRPLLVSNETIRFRDEPAETWFRQRFRPTADQMVQFVDRLKPLAADSVYVAASLPSLMLEAGMLDELVTIALDATLLPNTSTLDRRDVELQRLQFALKASLRARQWKHAAKLALKSGTASASNDRQRKLLQENTDLAGIFMQSDQVLEVVSRRDFGASWMGSHHAFDAGLLSANEAFIPEARSHLRMANDWLLNWSRITEDERDNEHPTSDDIAEIALALLNVEGAQRCARWLRGWTPRSISYSAGRIMAARLVDRARYDDLKVLAIAARNDAGLILAINQELRKSGRGVPAAVITRTVDLLANNRLPAQAPSTWNAEDSLTGGVLELVAEAQRRGTHSADVLVRLLTKYLPMEPPRGLASQFDRSRRVLLRAYALRAALMNQPLSLSDVAYPELRAELESAKPQSHQDSEDLRELRTHIGALLPWYQLYSQNIVKRLRANDIGRSTAKATRESSAARAHSYREQAFLNDEIAAVWFEILLDRVKPSQNSLAEFHKWVTGLKTPLSSSTLASLSRRAARHSDARAQIYAIAYANAAATAVEGERTHAETIADSLVTVARALLAVSPPEAAAYFDRAVQVASRVGNENLNRWGALIELAKRASARGSGKPEVAYRFARCAEVTYDYVDRDKHFDWEGTIEALAGLCPASCLAIASRWRDRQFGNPKRVIARAMKFLMKRGDIAAKTVQSLAGLRAYWDTGGILAAALADASTATEREALWSHALRYARVEMPSTKTWVQFKDLQTQYGLPPEGVDEFLAYAQSEEKDPATSPGIFSSNAESTDRPWDKIFAKSDLTVSENVAASYQRFMSGEAPYNREKFYKAATARIPPGDEAAFITAAGALPNFDAYECQALLESIPETWRSQLGVRSAIAKLILALCNHRWTEITLNRYWQPLPISLAVERSGLEVDTIVGALLASAGKDTELFDSDRMFTLVALIGTKLEDVSAQEALEYGLDQFTAVLKDSDGDGPWSGDLAPSSEIGKAIAGYLWAGLGNPRDGVRWESAHAVLGICAFREDDLLARLIDCASSGAGVVGGASPFTDATLPFYRYHAMQWLLLALLRSATEYPHAVSRHLVFLTRLSLEGEPHVVFRDFAARAALAIDERIAGSLDSSVRLRLASVNTSPFPPVVRSGHGHFEENSDEAGENGDDDDFFFGIDIGPYWFSPLARVFAIPEKHIERAARRVMRDDWNVQAQSRWDADERARRRLYDDREDSHSHGSRPRTDNLHFYLSYHAMMVVAGQLLNTRPVVQHPDDDDDFSEWLNRHSLTRKDGRWLADRRDPAPLNTSTSRKTEKLDTWRWSLSRSDFDAQLFRNDGRVTLWGSWTWVDDYRAEIVDIRSALVTPERSRSLLVALQTTTDAHDYGIPAEGDELEISSNGYELVGWVNTSDRSSGIDDRDPWSGEISYPGPTPSESVSELMSLIPDSETREWVGDGYRALRSEIWGEYPESPDRDEVQHGHSLHACTEFLRSLMRATKKNIIVKVSLERRYKYGRYQPYSNRADEEVGPLLPNVRVFLFEGDGDVRTV